MPTYSKRYRHLKSARQSKAAGAEKAEVTESAESAESAEICWINPPQHLIDWLDSESLEDMRVDTDERGSDIGTESDYNEDNEEESEYIDNEEDMVDEFVFEILMMKSKSLGFLDGKTKYQRGPEVSERTAYRNKRRLKELHEASKGCKLLMDGFLELVNSIYSSSLLSRICFCTYFSKSSIGFNLAFTGHLHSLKIPSENDLRQHPACKSCYLTTPRITRDLAVVIMYYGMSHRWNKDVVM